MGRIKIYPAVFVEAEEGGYTVDFPDFGGECFTEGDTLVEAYEMAQDVLAGTIVNRILDKENLPIPTDNVSKIPLNENEFINFIQVDIDFYKDSDLTKTVRKNVSLPYWLSKVVDEKNINVSRVLQEALYEVLGLAEYRGSENGKLEGIIEIAKAELERKNSLMKQR